MTIIKQVKQIQKGAETYRTYARKLFGVHANWIPQEIMMGIPFQFYPTYKQLEKLPQLFGNSRFLWNELWYILKIQYIVRQQYYKRHHIVMSKLTKKQRKKVLKKMPKALKAPSKTKLDKLLTKYKKEPKYSFLKKSDSRALQLEIAKLLIAIHRAAKGVSKAPNFKSKKSHYKSYCTDSPTVRKKSFIHDKHHVMMPKLGLCRVNMSRKVIGQVKQVTVEVRPTGKFYIVPEVACKSQALPATQRFVGIDMNLTYLAVLSTGQKYNLKHFYKTAHPKLKEWQKKTARRYRHAKVTIRQNEHYCKKHPYSKKHLKLYLSDFHNYIKARHKCAKIYRRVHNQATNYLQQITTSIVRRFDVICMEDLKVSNMVHNHHLARSIYHAYWRAFRVMIEYKCKWYRKTFIAVNPANTSRCCWFCHTNNGKKKLGVEAWTCSNPHCPFYSKSHDRDINAAINILELGLNWIKPQNLQPRYAYNKYKFNSALITEFLRADYISAHRHGI